MSIPSNWLNHNVNPDKMDWTHVQAQARAAKDHLPVGEFASILASAVAPVAQMDRAAVS